MATEVITRTHAGVISLRWIISARDDLVWLIGSVASSYLLLILYVKGILPLVPMVAVWAILIDAPHVFGTFSRTYFDRTERCNRSRLLWGSLLFFTVGPIMVLAGAGLISFFIAALWAYYHLVKQHYGFMVLYKKKNNDLAPVDNALDRLLLLFAFNYPFVAFVAQDPEARVRVPAALKNRLDKLADATARSRAWLAAHALEVYVDDQEWQLAIIRKGKKDVQADRVISHDKTARWLRSWGKKRELPAPSCK